MSVLPEPLLLRQPPPPFRGRSRTPSRFSKALREHQALALQWGRMESATLEVAERLAACLSAGGKVLLCGQGASVTLCQHLAAVLAGRGGGERVPLAVLSLSCDLSVWPRGQDDGFARQVEALGRPGDALLVVCAGDGSTALKRAADRAGERGLLTLGLLGADSGGLSESCHLAITVPQGSPARVQEAQQFVGHTLCELIESALA